MKLLKQLGIALIAIAALTPGIAHADDPVPVPYHGGLCPLGTLGATATWIDDTPTAPGTLVGHYVYTGPGRALLSDFHVTQPVPVFDLVTRQDAVAHVKPHTHILAYFYAVSQDQAGTPGVEFDSGNFRPTPWTLDNADVAYFTDFGSIITKYKVCAGFGAANPPS